MPAKLLEATHEQRFGLRDGPHLPELGMRSLDTADVLVRVTLVGL
jgi:hypothetical protein